MHAHTLQQQNLLAAPLIVHSAADAGEDEQEIVVLLHDFSFTPTEELLTGLKKRAGSQGMKMGGMSMGGMGQMANMMTGMDHADLMKHMAQMRGNDALDETCRDDGGNGSKRHRLRRLSRQ
jgi:hypothetical protein